MDCESFYRERDKRTISYGTPTEIFDVPVGIAIGDLAARTRAGQTALLALVNLCARVHRRLEILVPEVPVLVSSLWGGDDLSAAVHRAIAAIDPCNQTSVVREVRKNGASIAIGDVQGAARYLGCEGMLAELGRNERAVVDRPGAVFGAGLAACMGAAAIVHMAAGYLVTDRRLSLWNYAEGAAALPGDSDDRQINVGAVLMIGAGAVGSATSFWLQQVGVNGDWTVADGDAFELHNINRTPAASAADAGWPHGISANKADAASRIIGARSYPGWYDAWLEEHDGEPPPDLILPLANARGVRPAIAARGDKLVVHATTGDGWTAELHRHERGRDDCIACRLPEPVQSSFICSTGEFKTVEGDPSDAALPFLSAAAGLMLVRFLDTLSDGEVSPLRGPNNHWAISFGPPGVEIAKLRSRRWPPRDGCTHVPPSRATDPSFRVS